MATTSMPSFGPSSRRSTPCCLPMPPSPTSPRRPAPRTPPAGRRAAVPPHRRPSPPPSRSEPRWATAARVTRMWSRSAPANQSTCSSGGGFFCGAVASLHLLGGCSFAWGSRAFSCSVVQCGGRRMRPTTCRIVASRTVASRPPLDEAPPATGDRGPCRSIVSRGVLHLDLLARWDCASTLIFARDPSYREPCAPTGAHLRIVPRPSVLLSH